MQGANGPAQNFNWNWVLVAAGDQRVPARPILIAQISDLHITPPGVLAYDRVDTATALRATIDTLNRFAPRLDLVVISGDVANSGLPEEYAHAKALLGGLQIPYVVIPGNHDKRVAMGEVFPGDSAGGSFNATRRVSDLDILLIDSTVPGAAYGELDTPTLAWLDAALAAAPTRPALLFLHHPPFDSGITYMDAIKLRNADALAALLQRHPRALLVAAGHLHRAVQGVFAGVTATICPAGEQAAFLNFDPQARDVIVIEPQSFHLHIWLPGTGLGRLVTHVMPIGEFAGPYPCA